MDFASIYFGVGIFLGAWATVLLLKSNLKYIKGTHFDRENWGQGAIALLAGAFVTLAWPLVVVVVIFVSALWGIARKSNENNKKQYCE